ncbi:MAG TPA: helix-turn-helix domain-containing protein [Spongiibacteraceae bacterium]|nr:helix-turn-helix domain-containing protein [Spongiibacteraceae bacterium]
MSDVSGPNSRVIEVLNFLAAHPTEAFTLSELAEQLRLSNGSAHRVLTSLTDARYLARHPKHKTYSLGVALVAIGQAAMEKHRGIDIARREMARLADELKAQCIATAIVDDELLFLAKEGVSQTHDGLSRVGERRPFVPPLGLGHIAWADKKVLESYLVRAQSTLSDSMRDYLKQALEVIRRRGYVIAANGEALSALRQTTTLSIHRRRDDAFWSQVQGLIGALSEKEIQLLDIADAGSAGVSYISAPVFSPTGSVTLELALSGMPDNLNIAEIERYAERLRAAAAVVTSETHGTMPAKNSYLSREIS